MGIDSIGAGFNSFIEGAAALFVLYWLLSTLSSFLVESISSMCNTRGNALRLFAIDMVQGELNRFAVPGAEEAKPGLFQNRYPRKVWWNWFSSKVDMSDPSITDFSRALFAHPLMRALEQPKVDRGSPNTAPAYVPSEVFAKTVLDLLRNAGSVKGMVTEADIAALAATAERAAPALTGKISALVPPLVQQLAAVSFTPTMNGYEAARAALEAVFATPAGASLANDIEAAAPGTFPAASTPAQKAAVAADSWFGGAAGPLAVVQAPLPATVQGVITALYHDNVPDALRRSLRPLMDAANHDMDRLSNEIAVWYDASMQRATGWYKRYSMVWLGVVGLVFAVLFNVDSPRIVGALIESPALRSAGYAAAVQVVESEGKPEGGGRIVPQVAYSQAFDRLCGRSGPVATDFSTMPDCSEAGKKALAGRKTYLRLLPLTMASPDSAQLTGFVAMRMAGGTDMTLVRQLQAFCDKGARCGNALKTEVTTYLANAATATDGKVLPLTPVADALANDPGLFWHPGIVQGLLADKFEPETLKSARIVAEASGGAVSGYVSGLPGLGLVWEVAKQEQWAGWDWLRLALGWALTAALVSLGAPFWFDLLQSIVNRRGAGPKPEEAARTPLN